ncbi:hypothetical protein ABBQ32_010687 [Trebouxia sp. C0010 RCD-2024]
MTTSKRSWSCHERDVSRCKQRRTIACMQKHMQAVSGNAAQPAKLPCQVEQVSQQGLGGFLRRTDRLGHSRSLFLQISGRWEDNLHLDRKDRLCLVCRSTQQVEDEHHFLFDCPMYSSIRASHAIVFQRACSVSDFFAYCEANACGGFY